MNFDDILRDQLSRGQPPLIALHNAANAYAAAMKQRDCSQYADETQAWSEPQDSGPEKSLVDKFLETEEGRRQFAYEKLKYELEEAVELLRDARALLKVASNRPTYTRDEADWIDRVRKFLEGK